MNIQKLTREYQAKIDGYDKLIKHISEQIRKDRDDESLAFERRRLEDLRQLCVQFIHDLDSIT